MSEQDTALVERLFDPWRVPASDTARGFCSYIQKYIEEYEREHGLRRRRRNRTEQSVFALSVSALACDLLHHSIAYVRAGRGRSAANSEDALKVTLSHRHLGTADPSRSPVMSKALPGIVNRMEACGFIKMSMGHTGSKGFKIPPQQTAIRPTRHFIDLAIGRKVGNDGEAFAIKGFEDLAYDASQREPIILRAPKVRQGDKVIQEEIAYRETPPTRSLRSQMTVINEWLAKAPLALLNESQQILKGEGYRLPLRDPSDRFLNRIFTNGSFESGGRLYGGFWQSMPKHERDKAIIIAGEGVCMLDYSQMGPRIVYSLAKGAQPPPDDCYMIPHYAVSRKGVKNILNAAFFVDHLPTRFPAGTRHLFPQWLKFPELRDAILKFHAPIAEYLFSSRLIGHKLQNIESCIMVDVLLALKEAGIPAALPIHDAVIVPVSASMLARDAMQQAFHKHTGMDALIHME